ncbi:MULTISPECIES: hypothetical protein [unclassified Streptomyces]|uniref:hypothetical protein n=1 Tax=unclassified Streptomyces TaxID=2593676 RepID=UPI0022501C8B|nr:MULTISPECIES: hypothetical protein [unclassified Streptomyces]MCX5139896.1 hypothetical protein [Streptomyces sp. NBC_00338]WRZ64544.1 hypothetical protein OG408_11865 [Streptomyces sp. NBC_01257]WSU58507.1 hypothetical protein OG450_11830 [Streptomyces sp. NBC_01104]
MLRTFDRVGDRILRAVLPAAKASAACWDPWKTIFASSTYVLQQRNACTGSARQCRVSISGAPYQSATCP